MAEIVSTEKRHSRTGASGASRWMNCHGSVRLISAIPQHEQRKSGREAALGTAAHEVLNLCLIEDRNPWQYHGKMVAVEGSGTFEVDDNMVEALTVATDWLDQHIPTLNPENGDFWFTERDMTHSQYPDDLYGTCDVGIVRRVANKFKITIFDYKHGEGVVVEPTSPQIKYYAALVIDDMIQTGQISGWMEIAEIELVICQPRHIHHLGPVRSDTMSGLQLLDWFEMELVTALEKTKEKDALLKIGDWCKFCPAYFHCPGLKKNMVSFDLNRDVERISNEELGDIITRGITLEKYVAKAKDLALKRMENGHKVPGMKMVQKKVERVWKSAAKDALVETYGEDAYEPVALKSPARIDALKDGKKFTARYAMRPSDIGLTIAPVSDSRPEAKRLTSQILDLIDTDALIALA